jgi:hypothetical protein
VAAFSHVAFHRVARSSARRRPILLVTLGCAAARLPRRAPALQVRPYAYLPFVLALAAILLT